MLTTVLSFSLCVQLVLCSKTFYLFSFSKQVASKLNENESRGAASAKFSKKQNKIKAGEREREVLQVCLCNKREAKDR
jgi:hypothetical protein